MHGLEVVPRHVGAVLRVGAGRLARLLVRAVAEGRRRRAVNIVPGGAPGAEDLAEDRVLGVVHVGRVGAAARGVLELYDDPDC